jgi:hypothetical protein
MNEKIEKFIQDFYMKFPSLRPILKSLYGKFLADYTFSGWGMQTTNELPWNDKYEENFRNDCTDIKEIFEFTPNSTGADKHNMDDFMWRHWIISFSIRYVMTFTQCSKYNFVECGVGDGMTAFFAGREIKRNDKINDCKIHLYDSWSSMKSEDLLESEKNNIGRYNNLNLERTKKNLLEFNENITYHPGYIPESFSSEPSSPDEIVYLHIDLNSTKPTLDALNFFFPLIITGGIIIFDDYGNRGYPETKKQIDDFFFDKPGILMKSPTGQAIYFCK